MSKPNIGLDCRLSGEKHAAGIGRYITNLAINLPATTQEFNWVYFFHHQEQADQVLANLEPDLQEQVKVVIAPIRHYSFKEQLVWPQVLAKEALSLLHVPHFNVPLIYPGKLVVTIHDLLWHQQIGPEATTLPGWKYYFKYLAYRFVTNQAVKKSHTIFVPAQTIKETVTDYFPQAEAKIVITKEGISSGFQNKYQHLKQEGIEASSPNPSLIYVGSLYPHKNIDLVLSALRKMPDLTLTVVSARNAFSKRF